MISIQSHLRFEGSSLQQLSSEFFNLSLGTKLILTPWLYNLTTTAEVWNQVHLIYGFSSELLQRQDWIAAHCTGVSHKRVTQYMFSLPLTCITWPTFSLKLPFACHSSVSNHPANSCNNHRPQLFIQLVTLLSWSLREVHFYVALRTEARCKNECYHAMRFSAPCAKRITR